MAAPDNSTWPEKLGQLITCLIVVGQMAFLNAMTKEKQVQEVSVQGLLIDKICGIIPCEVHISNGHCYIDIEDTPNEVTTPKSHALSLYWF